MAEVYCGSEPCPLFLNSTCVFYTGESLLYIGVQNNDTLETIIVKINQAFQNAGVGYAFTNGLIQPTPFQPVQLGGALIQNTTIGGNFTLTFAGNVQAAKHITTGGSSSQFVKGDGTLDSTAYQPAANYITGLSGDATASGPGVAAMTLATVNFAPGTFGNGNTIPIVTVNAKGLVTNITPVPITLPPLPLTFIGDVVGSGFTGSSITLLMQNVNANPYNTITPLKFSVNGKGLVTGASPITASDIVNILGYYPGTSGTSGSAGTSGTSGTTGTSGTSGTSATSGTSGTTGTSGTSATSGTSGTSGTDGTGGTSGTSGSTGTSGTSGTSGTAGTSGTSGTTGTSGSSGTSGSTGTSGSSGTTGTSGSSGTTGTSGSSGTSGTTGTSGSSGTSGTTGLDGTNGTSGTSGTTGTSGSSGTSGTSATSGSSGTSGTTGTSGTSGLSGDRFKTTSTTTYTLQAPGNPGTLTVDPGLAYTVGQSIIIAFDANNHNEAEVTSYDSVTGVINFVTFTLTGSGTYSSWFVNIDGASGGDGSSGTSGTAGTSGSSGTSGTTGTSGSSGTSGTSSTGGTSGTSGTSGIDGTSGTSGTSGTTGTSGSSGTSGTTGTSGSSGTSGTSATNGTGGTSGTSGSSGTSGTTGTSGTSATSGTSGTSATSGTTGTSGTSGTNGTGGTSGTSGTSATSGTSGTSGATGASGTSGTSGTSVAVSGTTNTMAKFTSATTIGNSALTDNGSTLTYTGSAVTSPTINVNSGNSFVAQSLNNNGGFAMNNASTYWGLMWNYAANDWRLGYGSTTAQVGWNLRWDNGSTVWANGSFRAPLFYDSDNTGYYIDGAGTSVLNILNFPSGSSTINTTTPGTSGYQLNFTGQSTPDYAQAITWGWSTSGAQAGIYVQSSGSYGTRMYIATTDSFATGARTAMTINESGIITTTRNYLQAAGSLRAPIFYDSDDTGYYADFNSTSSSAIRLRGGMLVGPNTTWGAYLQVGGNGHASASYANVVTTNGNLHLDAASGCQMYLNYYVNGTIYLNGTTYSISSNGSYYNGTSANTNSISSATGGSYTWTATNYFQSNLGGYSGSLSSPPLQAYSTGNNSAFMSFHKGGNYAVNMGLDADNVLRIGGWSASANRWQLDMSGNVYVAGSSRAPIFYDIDNTTYYLDLTSTTSGVIRGNFIFNDYGAGIVGSYSSYRYQAVFAMGDAYKLPIDGTTTGNLYGIAWSHPNAGGVAGNLNTHGALILENGTFLAALSGSIRARDDMRAPIFYDSADTGYYLNLNGGSYLYSLILSGNAYFRPSTWIQFDANYGLYWPNSYGAHLYPNTGSSYTQLRLDGNKNGYGGIWDSYSAVAGIMYDSGGNGGVYREANGRWYWYYYLPNDCMGIGTSSTSSSYSLYLNKGVYAQSRIDATIYYDSANTAYYLDPNGASYLASSLEIANGYVLTNGVGGAIYVSSAQGSFGGYVRFAQHAVIESINGGYHIYVLDASGIGVVKYSGNQSWSAYSDGRIKTIHSMMQNNLSKLDGINPIYYSFNNFDDDKNRIGLIAQEVQQHFPELVDTDPKTDNLTLDYIGLIPVLLGAIKELKTEVETLKTKI